MSRQCAHCGRRMEHPEASMSYRVGDEFARHDLCHPNEDDLPDCYRLVTVYHRPLGELKAGDNDERLLAVAQARMLMDDGARYSLAEVEATLLGRWTHEADPG